MPADAGGVRGGKQGLSGVPGGRIQGRVGEDAATGNHNDTAPREKENDPSGVVAVRVGQAETKGRICKQGGG